MLIDEFIALPKAFTELLIPLPILLIIPGPLSPFIWISGTPSGAPAEVGGIGPVEKP